MKHIERTQYLNELKETLGTLDIKIITGIRRSGKSDLLLSFINYLKTINNVNIVSVNLQDLGAEHLLEYHALHKYVMDNYDENKMNVLLIDEVQLCPKFELAINSLHSKQIFDIYLTGSNAFLLSSDLATLFTGRTIEIKIFPFSFKEFVEYKEITSNYYDGFEKYSSFGGMPGSLVYEDSKRYNYLRDVFNTILIRDLVNKYRIRNELEFKNISDYMMDNIGNIHSPYNITESLNKNNSKITCKTVSKYIKFLQNSFLIYEAKRYDLKGRRYLLNSSKYYLVDPCFRYATNGSKNKDYGRIYENIVFIELLRRGYEVYVGKLYQKVIDFVAIKGDEKLYIQVSDSISAKETFEREYKPLLSIRDGFKKVIISRTFHERYLYEGIEIYDIANWLIND